MRNSTPNSAQAKRAVEIHPNLPRLYRQKVEHLREALVDEETRPMATTLIRSLIDRIEVVPGGKRGEAEVEIVGGLAMVLNFIRQKKTAASGTGGDGTFLMVAGAGFGFCALFAVDGLRPIQRYRMQLPGSHAPQSTHRNTGTGKLATTWSYPSPSMKKSEFKDTSRQK